MLSNSKCAVEEPTTSQPYALFTQPCPCGYIGLPNWTKAQISVHNHSMSAKEVAIHVRK